MPTKLTVQEILAFWKSGQMSQTEAETALLEANITPADYQNWLDLIRTTPKDPQRPEYAAQNPVQGPVQKDPRLKFDASGNVLQNYGTLPESENPFGAYQRGLGEAGFNAGIGGGEFGDYLKSRLAPTSAVFLGGRALRGNLPAGQVEPEDAFAQYARQTRGGNLGGEAQSTFQGLVDKLRGGDVNTLAEGDPARAFLTPDTGNYGMVTDLAREAARGRLGGYAASRLLPSNDELIRQFRAGPTGAQNTDLLRYLQHAFGL